MENATLALIPALLILIVIGAELARHGPGRMLRAVAMAPHASAAAGVVVVAGIAMPPDIMSQASLALPLFMLCEVAIWASRRWG